MIKINLLTVERKGAKKKLAFDPAHKLVAAGSLLLVAAVLFIGWRYWSLDKESKRLDAEIAGAERESARLKTVLAEVQQYEQRTTQMRERVSLIEQLTAPFAPEEYKDTYTGELTRVIEQKAKGRKPRAKGAAPAPTRVNDLMAALKKSLEQQKQQKKRAAAA